MSRKGALGTDNSLPIQVSRDFWDDHGVRL